MELFLCRVKHTSDYNYSLAEPENRVDELTGKTFISPKDKIPILDCTIEASVFSCMKVALTICQADLGSRIYHILDSNNRFIPYRTTFGLGMFDDKQLENCFVERYQFVTPDYLLLNNNPKYYGFYRVRTKWKKMPHVEEYLKTDFEPVEETEKFLKDKNAGIYIGQIEKPYCLLSNRENNFVPLVIAKMEYYPKDNAPAFVKLTLVEKRACALSLWHKLECFSPKDTISEDECNNKNMAKGLLSVPEIIERLSVVPEDEDKVLSDNSCKIKNIVNFSSAGINRDKDKGPTDPKEQTEHCAFLSRFIAPASQSRLSIIYSLARKYGYGLIYRPRSHQYYAIDLLSSTAPGFPLPTSSLFDASDVYDFDDGENNNSSCSKKLIFDFTDFAIEHFYDKSTYFGSALRTSHFVSHGCQCTSRSFPLSTSTPSSSFFSLCNTNAYTNKHKEGSSRLYYEDEVSLVKPKDSKNPTNAFADIDTVNKRLNYAKFKSKYFENNINLLIGDFYSENTRPNHEYNLVYEILNRLGCHTDLFARAAECTKPKVLKRDKKTSSSSTHYIDERDVVEGTENQMGFMNRFYQNNLYDNTESIFGYACIAIQNINAGKRENRFKLAKTERCDSSDAFWRDRIKFHPIKDIEEVRPNRIVGSRYAIHSQIHLYSDVTDHNFGKTDEEAGEVDNPDLEYLNVSKSDPGSPEMFEPPELPTKPDLCARRIIKLENNVHFTCNSQQYSYDNKVIDTLCSYITSHIKSNIDKQRRNFDKQLCQTWKDPLLVIKTYLAYKRYSNFTDDLQNIEQFVSEQDEAEDMLASHKIKDKEEIEYAKFSQKAAREGLERLSKTLAGQRGGFIKDKKTNLWRRINDEEKKDYNYCKNVEEIDDIPSTVVLSELEKIKDEKYIEEIAHNMDLEYYTNRTDGGAR